MAKCKQLGAQEAFYISLDMGKQEDTVRLIDEAKIRLGGLDHLILNHIIYSYSRLWTGDIDMLKRVSHASSNLKLVLKVFTNKIKKIHL